MKNQPPSHDDFVRKILSDKDIATAYFKEYLPAEMVSRLDFASLTQLPETYLSEHLQKTMSDIVYSCRLKEDSKTARLSLLIEHKSHPDKYTPVQIGGYIFSALQKQISNKEPLSLVVPVLLYHGEKQWTYQTISDLFKDIEPEWKQYIPEFNYVYTDLGVLSDEAIEAVENKFLAASFLAMKHSQQKPWINQNAIRLLEFAFQGNRGLLKTYIIYLYSRSEIPESILNSLPYILKKDVMNTLDIYYEKGIEKGIEKGRVEGIEKGRVEGIEKGRMEGIEEGKEQIVQNLLHSGRFSIADIADLAGVPVEVVMKVKNALEK